MKTVEYVIHEVDDRIVCDRVTRWPSAEQRIEIYSGDIDTCAKPPDCDDLIEMCILHAEEDAEQRLPWTAPTDRRRGLMRTTPLTSVRYVL